jgi:hypothetical protein
VKPFNYRGHELTCLWCGEKLRKSYQDVPGTHIFDDWRHRCENDPEIKHDYEDSWEEQERKRKLRDSLLYKMKRSPIYSQPTGKYGYEDAGFFCSGTCAKYWAHAWARRGHRLVKRDESDPEEIQ